MPSGAAVHRQLVDRIEHLEEEVSSTAAAIEARESEVGTLGDRRAAAYRALAEMHLPAINAESVTSALAEMEARVRAIHEEKQARRTELLAAVPEARDAIAKLEVELDGRTDALNRIGEERDRLTAVVDEELSREPGWDDLTRRVRTARARAAAAEGRYQAALTERADKLPGYEADVFFSYLLGRGYGTSRATGNVVTRRLDAWVAEVSGYVEDKGDYDLLRDLPDHAAAVRDRERSAFEEVAAGLRERTSVVAAKHGLDAVLRDGEAQYLEREKVIATRRDAEQHHLRLQDELAALDDEHGAYYQRAVGEVQAWLEGHTASELLERARATSDPRDDAIVAELQEIEAALMAARADIVTLRMSRSDMLVRLKELKNLRHEFETGDWNGGRSTFASGFDMDDLVVGYLAGRHSASHLRGHVRAHQHFKPREDYSSTWASGGRFAGGGGGGGHSSGGGFGGGGKSDFRTGGGF